MRTLGVHGAGEKLYLTLAVDGAIIDLEPYTFAEPHGLALDIRLDALANSAMKIVQTFDVAAVAILDPEPTYKVKAVDFIQRATLETMFAYGATLAGIPCSRLDRRHLRSVLSLSRDGELHSHVSELTPKVGPNWNPRMRDLAALAALAAAPDV